MTKGHDAINVLIQVIEEQGKLYAVPVVSDLMNILVNISDQTWDEMLAKYHRTHVLEKGKAVNVVESE